MQVTHVPSVEQTMIARGHLNVTRNVLMEERSSPAWSPSPMQPECQVLTVNIPRGEQTHFDSSDNILENTLLIMHIAKHQCLQSGALLCSVKFSGNPVDLRRQTTIVKTRKESKHQRVSLVEETTLKKAHAMSSHVMLL